MSWRGHAVLQVPIPALEDWIRERNRFYDAGFVSDDPHFSHAHITVLAPLANWDEEAIAQIAAQTAPFEVELAKIDVFPNGIIYLLPEPDCQLRSLTRAAWDSHPKVVPNGAPDPQPHLTLDALSELVSVDSTGTALGDLVPTIAQIDRLELVWYEAGNCHFIRSWELQGVKE